MTVDEVVEQLQRMGSEGTARVLRNHGAHEPCLGVKIGDMKPLQKQLKKNYALSLELYDTGIYDAMYLAGLIAEPELMTKKDLTRWFKTASNPIAGYVVGPTAASSPAGWSLSLAWKRASHTRRKRRFQAFRILTQTKKRSILITAITPYLFFSGRCEEALEFYREALGAKVDMVMRFNESPDPPPPGMLQPGFESKVMHSSFTVHGIRLMASDGCDDKSTLHGFQLALSVDNPDTAHKVFDALAAGGRVQMPLSKTFWSPCFGMVADKFNVVWMVMVP